MDAKDPATPGNTGGAQHRANAHERVHITPAAQFARLREIASVLAHHGIAGAATAAETISGGHPEIRRLIQSLAPSATLPLPAHIRRTLEDLGPVFVKLGQALSTHPDIVTPELAAELSKLQDNVPPEPIDTIRGVIADELGAEPESIFASFDPAPLASASIGQAHLASLDDGTEVVVKVRRPKALETAELDLSLLHQVAERADATFPELHDIGIIEIIDDFSETLREELDYLHEADNARHFARAFADDPRIHVPRVLDAYSTDRVLTLERATGIKIDDIAALDSAGVDRRELAAASADMILRMVFEQRRFHADLHPGNLFIKPDGSIWLIDFGMVGELTEKDASALSHMVIAFASGDAELLADSLLSVSTGTARPDRRGLVRDLSNLIAQLGDEALGDIDVTDVGTRLLSLLRVHRLRLRGGMGRLVRTIGMSEGTGRRLDPAFSLVAATRPWALRALVAELSPRALARRAASSLAQSIRLGSELPGAVRRILKDYESDGVSAHIPTEELEPLVSRVERLSNRLIAGMIAAALIQGLGQLASAQRRLGSLAAPMAAIGVGVGGALTAYLALTARPRRLWQKGR